MEPESPGGVEARPVPATGARGYELPSARQVVGRGLQLALESSADIRRASLYIGLLLAAVAGPAAVLLLVDLPTLLGVPWTDPYGMTVEQAESVVALIGPLYIAGALALLGMVTILVDGQLVAVSLLAARLAGTPLALREAVARARQTFWRYGFAAFAVGLLSLLATTLVNLVTDVPTRGTSIGATLFATFLAAVVTAPFGYILMAVVAGDVDGGTALRRSVTLARARPALAAVVAAFAFLSSTITVLGLGVALELVNDVALFVRPDLELGSGTIVLAVPIVLVALVAYGSLSVTVAAIAASPQVTAFLGLTHYAAGLDRARTAVPAASAEAASPDVGLPGVGPGQALPAHQWQRPEPARRPVRWVTIPMLVLIGLEVLVAASGIVRAAAG